MREQNSVMFQRRHKFSETRQPVSRHGPIWTSQSRNKQLFSRRALEYASTVELAYRITLLHEKLFELRDWVLSHKLLFSVDYLFRDGLIVGLERSRLNGASKFLDLGFIDLARFAGKSLRLR
jgi:hypothetical protein